MKYWEKKDNKRESGLIGVIFFGLTELALLFGAWKFISLVFLSGG